MQDFIGFLDALHIVLGTALVIVSVLFRGELRRQRHQLEALQQQIITLAGFRAPPQEVQAPPRKTDHSEWRSQPRTTSQLRERESWAEAHRNVMTWVRSIPKTLDRTFWVGWLYVMAIYLVARVGYLLLSR